MKKKLLILALVLTMILSSFTVIGFATDSPAYGLTSAQGLPGEEIEVYISIENNPGIISLRHYIYYDDSVFELTAVEDLELLAEYTTPSPTVSSPYILRWADALATENNNANGQIAKLTFTIKEDAVAGDYEISVELIESRTWVGEKIIFEDATATLTVLSAAVTEPETETTTQPVTEPETEPETEPATEPETEPVTEQTTEVEETTESTTTPEAQDDTDSSINCSCACHSTGFAKGWFNFLTFFRQLFGMTQYQVCGCGAYHW